MRSGVHKIGAHYSRAAASVKRTRFQTLCDEANRTVFAQDWEAQNVTLIVCCRKDIVLCRSGQAVQATGERTLPTLRHWANLLDAGRC